MTMSVLSELSCASCRRRFHGAGCFAQAETVGKTTWRVRAHCIRTTARVAGDTGKKLWTEAGFPLTES